MVEPVIGMFDDRSKHCSFEQQQLQQKEGKKEKKMKYR